MGTTKQPNQLLAAAVAEAGLSHKGFAARVRAQAERDGHPISSDHVSVRRWLDGSMPRGRTTMYIAAVLSAKLGRRIMPADLGLVIETDTGVDVPGVPVDFGLAYCDTSHACVDTLTQLVQLDLDGLSTLLQSSPSVSAWSDVSLSWLVGRTVDLPANNAQGCRVGAADVARLRATRDMFDRLDNQFGGGHARQALIQYLHSDLPGLLRGKCANDVRSSLFSAAAEAVQLAAWMSYDAGLHGMAQRYFIQALGLAHTADDRLLAASILDSMSHQATFLGRFKEAVNMVRAARMGLASLGTPILAAHLYVMEARALARLGYVTACHQVLSAAVTEFERHRAGEGPEWIQYFDDAELSAEFSHCNRDLGRAVDASRFAEQSLGRANGDYLRSDFFATMVLADSYIDQGEVEEACAVALGALNLGDQLKSARCATYIIEFRARLASVGNCPAVANFLGQARSTSLWAALPVGT